MNLGLIELLNGNYSNANKYFGAAGGQQGLGDALGTYYLKMGDNAAAARALLSWVLISTIFTSATPPDS